MGLFWISREYKFEVYNHGMQVLTRQEKENFIGGKEVGKAMVNQVHGFSLAESLPGKKRGVFLFLLGSAVITGHESSPFWSPDSI